VVLQAEAAKAAVAKREEAAAARAREAAAAAQARGADEDRRQMVALQTEFRRIPTFLRASSADGRCMSGEEQQQFYVQAHSHEVSFSCRRACSQVVMLDVKISDLRNLSISIRPRSCEERIMSGS